MGWFSNPKCPQCGRETTICKDFMCQMYYKCDYCIRKNTKEKEEKEDLLRRIKALENAK